MLFYQSLELFINFRNDLLTFPGEDIALLGVFQRCYNNNNNNDDDDNNNDNNNYNLIISFAQIHKNDQLRITIYIVINK